MTSRDAVHHVFSCSDESDPTRTLRLGHCLELLLSLQVLIGLPGRSSGFLLFLSVSDVIHRRQVDIQVATSGDANVTPS